MGLFRRSRLFPGCFGARGNREQIPACGSPPWAGITETLPWETGERKGFRK